MVDFQGVNEWKILPKNEGVYELMREKMVGDLLRHLDLVNFDSVRSEKDARILLGRISNAAIASIVESATYEAQAVTENFIHNWEGFGYGKLNE